MTHINTVPWVHPAISCFTAVVQLSWLLLPRRLSAKRNALLLKMPRTTACIFVAVVRILSVLHINNDIIQLGVPDLLVYTVSLNLTFHSNGTLWYDLFSLFVITALRERARCVMPALRWQLVERQCQGRNIRMYLCVNWCKTRKFTFCIVNFDTELERRIVKTPTVCYTATVDYSKWRFGLIWTFVRLG